jgi:hypothetical protein
VDQINAVRNTIRKTGSLMESDLYQRAAFAGQVGDKGVSEVEGELRMGGQVRQPGAGRGCRDPARVDVIA